MTSTLPLQLLRLLIVLMPAALASGKSVGFPADIRHDLQRQASALSPLTVNMVTRTTARHSEADALAAMGLAPWRSPETVFFRQEQRFVVQDLRFFSSAVSHVPGGPIYGRFTYDGRFYYGGDFGTAIERDLYERRVVPPPFGFEYLPAVGFQSYSVTGQSLTPDLVPRLFALLDGEGQMLQAGMAEVEGHTLAVVSVLVPNEVYRRAWASEPAEVRSAFAGSLTPPDQVDHVVGLVERHRELPEHLRLDFYHDPDRAHAVVQIDKRFPDGRLLERTTNSDFEQLDDREIWLPRQIVIDKFWFEDNPETVFDVPVVSTAIEVQGSFGLAAVPDDTFRPTNIKAGTILLDRTLPDPVQFIVAAGEEELAEAMLTHLPEELPPHIRKRLSTLNGEEHQQTGTHASDTEQTEPLHPSLESSEHLAVPASPPGRRLGRIVFAVIIGGVVLTFVIVILRRP